MPWLDFHGGRSLALTDIIATVQNNHVKWETKKNHDICVDCSEGSIVIKTLQQFSLKDTCSLQPLEHTFKLFCFSDIVFLSLPNLSFIVTGNQIYCRRCGVIETEAAKSWLSLLKTCPSFKSLEIALEGEQIVVEEILPVVMQLFGDILRVLFDSWKSVNYSSPTKKDLQSALWRELAQNWILSFRELLEELKLFVKMISMITEYDRTLMNILPSPVIFMESLSELQNEMNQWRKGVDHVDNLIPLYFHQEETFLLKLDLPIVTGSAFIGFVLLVMSFTCMNITIPPYNSPDIIKIWAVFVSILASLLLVSFTSMFYWLRRNAPRTDLL